MSLTDNGVLEIIINKNDAEIILLKENVKASRCSFGINLIKEGILLEEVNHNEVLQPLKMIRSTQIKKVLGDTIHASKINKSKSPSHNSNINIEAPQKKTCQIF